MKYSLKITINKPIEEVILLFQDTDRIAEWQPGFISMEHIDGEISQPNSKYKMLYQMGKREVEMIETIIVNNLPKEFTATYEAKNVWNKVENNFESTEEGYTLYTTHNEFKLSGMMKLFGWMMPGTFKKQSFQYLKYFKTFVEKQ